MEKNISHVLTCAIKDSLNTTGFDKVFKEEICIDLPSDVRFGDLSTNVALRLARLIKKSPIDIAGELIANMGQYIEKGPLKSYIKQIKSEGFGNAVIYTEEDRLPALKMYLKNHLFFYLV